MFILDPDEEIPNSGNSLMNKKKLRNFEFELGIYTVWGSKFVTSPVLIIKC